MNPISFFKKKAYPIYLTLQKKFPDRRDYLAVLAIMKNEHWNVSEWLDHYFWQGANHIFIIDNGSDDDTADLIRSHQRFDQITLISLPEPHRQCAHYWTVFKRFKIKKRFRWLAVADADEFWYARKDKDLPSAIARFEEKFDVIYASWANFGCPKQASHPNSLRGELVYRQPDLAPHPHKKWIVRTDIVKKGSFMTHKIVGGCSSRTTVDNDYLQLNHYVTRSFDYWTKSKMMKGDVSRASNMKNFTLERFKQVNSLAILRDDELANLVCREKEL